MVYSAAIVATALAAGLASAAPFDTKIGTLSVSQVRNPSFVKHGPAALAKAYLKYGVPLPDGLAQILAELNIAKRSTGSAKNTPVENDLQYLTPVSIGTPAQVLNLDFDTGSSDLWVFSSETPKSSVNGQSIYDPSKSSTAKAVSGATWNISYGDGSSSSGNVYTDVVNVGGVSFKTQAVELAKQVSDQFSQDSNNDGLLGLAFSSINTVQPKQQKTFFDNIKSTLDDALFTADLKHDTPGTYNFGFIDDSLYTGSIAYTDVDSSQGFWMMTASGYGIGANTTFKSTSLKGIADTGTTLALLPDSIVTAYYKQVSGAKNDASQGGYVFPCSAKVPDFVFGVGSLKITVPAKYLNYAPITDGSSTCFGGIQSDADIGFSIFGDIILKAALVVFDGSQSTPRLGWAAKSL